jgi:chromosomal replication initiation ATPase DnaA
MNPLLTTVATEVAGEFGSVLSRILSPRRGRPEDARARAITMAVYQRVSPARPNFTDLGELFGRDRTTVRHALARVDGFVKKEALFEERLLEVVGRVRARQ